MTKELNVVKKVRHFVIAEMVGVPMWRHMTYMIPMTK